MKRIGTFDATDISNYNIQYLQGILHTYASLNQPECNLRYDYDLLEIKKSSSDLESVLKTEIALFKSQPLSLQPISIDMYNELLRKWLFETKPVSSKKREKEVTYVSALIKELTSFTNVYIINGLSSDYESVYLELGVYYDYLILEAERTIYLLYFNYSD